MIANNAAQEFLGLVSLLQLCESARSFAEGDGVPFGIVVGERHHQQGGCGLRMTFLIQAAQADLDGSRPQAAHSQAARHLDLAARTARENLAEARALVAGLTPAQLAGGTLPDALRRLSQASVVDATFGVDGIPRPLPMAIEVVLLRVCQEALSNVGKHAHAQSATVRLEYDPDSVRLEVGDDGDGFDPAGACDGFGLRGMRARVTEAGGTLTVGSQPGAGTRVSAMVPA